MIFLIEELLFEPKNRLYLFFGSIFTKANVCLCNKVLTLLYFKSRIISYGGLGYEEIYINKYKS